MKSFIFLLSFIIGIILFSYYNPTQPSKSPLFETSPTNSAREKYNDKITPTFSITVPTPNPLYEKVVLPPSSQPAHHPNNIYLEAIQELVKGNNSFGIELFKKMRINNTNDIFSPHSILNSLILIHAGAKEKAQKQIQNVLGLELNEQDNIYQMLADLNLSLLKHPSVKIDINNSIWSAQDYQFNYFFLSRLNWLNTELLKVNWDKPETAKKALKEWIKEKNDDSLMQSFSPQIPSGTSLMTLSTLFFRGEWGHPFEKKANKKDYFQLLNNKKVKIVFMNDTNVPSYPCIELENQTKVLNLPYLENSYGLNFTLENTRYGMLLILPELNNYTNFVSSFDYDKYSEIISSLKECNLGKISIPKFKFQKNYNLKEAFRALGLDYIFQPGNLDLSLNKPKEPVTDVFHDSFIRVTEWGTEAGSTTRMVIGSWGGPDTGFIANHPFLFIIHDHKSKTILFIGELLNPSI